MSDCSKVIRNPPRSSLSSGVLVGSERSYLGHIEPRRQNSVSLQHEALNSEYLLASAPLNSALAPLEIIEVKGSMLFLLNARARLGWAFMLKIQKKNYLERRKYSE